MIRQIRKIVLYSVIILCTSSCMSLNTHQTGRTLGTNNTLAATSFTAGSLNSERYRLFNNSNSFFSAEAGGIMGISENLDIGLKVNLSTHFTMLGKYQFLGNKESLFASGLGLELGISPFGLPVAGALGYSSSIAIHNSVHLGGKVAFTLSPRYSYFGFSNFTKEYRFDDINRTWGYSSGIMIGNKNFLSLEYSAFVNNTSVFCSCTPSIFSVSYMFRF